MNLKTLTFVVIISVIIGATIFWLTSNPPTTTVTSSEPKEIPASIQTIPTPTPLPSQPPIDKNTNLEMEIDQQVSPDFSEDYKKLKEEVNSSF